MAPIHCHWDRVFLGGERHAALHVDGDRPVMSIKQFLPHQKHFMQDVRSRKYPELWLYGSVGSGKSQGAACVLVRECVVNPGKYVMAATTIAQVWNVMVPQCEAYARAAGVHFKAVRGGNGYVEIGKSKVIVKGLKVTGAMDNSMGDDWRGGWFDETSLMKQEEFNRALSRMRVGKPVIMMTLNPDSPVHWTTRYIRDAEARRAKIFQFKLADNTYLDPEYMGAVEASICRPTPLVRPVYRGGIRSSGGVGLSGRDVHRPGGIRGETERISAHCHWRGRRAGGRHRCGLRHVATGWELGSV